MVAVASAIVLGVIVTAIRTLVPRQPMRASDNFRTLPNWLRRSFCSPPVVISVWGAIGITLPSPDGTRELANHGFLILAIAVAAWFVGAHVVFFDDDIVEGEWGRIEEITLTYVVVHIWEDRCLVLPSSVFTTQRFEGRAHIGSKLPGAIEFDVDWTVEPSRMFGCWSRRRTSRRSSTCAAPTDGLFTGSIDAVRRADQFTGDGAGHADQGTSPGDHPARLSEGA